MKEKEKQMVETFSNDLIENLERLKKYLQYKNRNYCRKYINDIIKQIEESNVN